MMIGIIQFNFEFKMQTVVVLNGINVYRYAYGPILKSFIKLHAIIR